MHSESRNLFARLPVGLLLSMPVFFLHYFVIPGLYDPGLHSKYIFLAFYLVVLAMLGLFRKSPSSPSLVRIPAWWAALALPMILTVSLLWARTPMEGIPAVARWWEVFLLFTLLLTTFSSENVRARFHRWLPRLGVVFVVVTSVAALGQLAWVVRGQGYSHGSTYWVLVSFAHRNLLTHAIALAMPLALLTYLRDRGAWLVVAGLALAVGGAALLLLLVRTSWLAMGLAVLAFGLGWLLTRKGLGATTRRKAGRRVLVLLGIGAVALAAGWLAFRPAVKEKGLLEKHSVGMVKAHYGSPAERSLFWGRTIDLWKEKPLTGHGAGSWKIEAPGREIGSSREAIGRGEVYVVRAHNDWLQLLAEGGMGAFLAFLMWGGLAVANSVRNSAGEQALRNLCYGLGLVIFLVIAFFSFPMERPSSYVWWAIYGAALLLSRDRLPLREVVRKPDVANWVSRILLLGLALVLAGLGWMWVRLDGQWLRAMDAGAQGRPSGVVELLDDEILSRQPLAPATTPLAWYRGMAQLELGDSTAALSDFQKAYLVHPRHPHVLNNLATLLNQQGEVDLARRYLQTAVEIAPLMEDVRLNLAALEFNAGRTDTAYHHLRVVPDSTTNAQYPVFRDAIVSAEMDRMIARHQGEKVHPVLVAMHQKLDWMRNLHRKAEENHLTLEHQVLLDALYILQDQQKSVSLEEYQLLYNQYHLDSIQ